jgi:hypothetical protein
LYGSIDEFGVGRANRRDSRYGVVAMLHNSSGDRTLSATAQLHKQFFRASDATVAYTYTDARDRMSADCFNVTCNLDFTPVDGTLNERRISTSRFQARHKITLGSVTSLPLGFQVGVFYNGYSGQPYTYIVRGDANADELGGGFDGNDIVYVPKSSADITLNDPHQYAALDRIIESEPCLRSQRGQIMRRNSCENHWITLLNARVAKLFRLGRTHSLEVTADVFNVANLLNANWGVRRFNSLGGDVSLLELTGYDQQKKRGVYDLLDVDREVPDYDASRWQLQLGMRYMF